MIPCKFCGFRSQNLRGLKQVGKTKYGTDTFSRKCRCQDCGAVCRMEGEIGGATVETWKRDPNTIAQNRSTGSTGQRSPGRKKKEHTSPDQRGVYRHGNREDKRGRPEIEFAIEYIEKRPEKYTDAFGEHIVKILRRQREVQNISQILAGVRNTERDLWRKSGREINKRQRLATVEQAPLRPDPITLILVERILEWAKGQEEEWVYQIVRYCCCTQKELAQMLGVDRSVISKRMKIIIARLTALDM